MPAPSLASPGSAVTPLPPAFADHFESYALTAEGSTLVAIDPVGTIVWLNPAWQRFAEQNAGSQLAERFGVGSCYYDGISEPLRAYYQEAFRSALASLTVFEQDYECSSASLFRLMRLRALPIRNVGLLLEHSCVVRSFREGPALAPSELTYLGANRTILQCSNCRRVQRADGTQWDWVPAWVARQAPNISHGICKVCLGFYWGKLLRRAGKTVASGKDAP